MKKASRIVVLLLCIVSVGCGNRDREETVIDSGLFDMEEIQREQDVQACYGWGVTNYDVGERNIIYNGGELQLDIEFDNLGKACEAGMMVFIDGIAQEYVCRGKAGYIVPVSLASEDKTDISIQFTPAFAQNGGEHEMYLACMYEPSYRPSEAQRGYGNYQNILPGLAWRIEAEETSAFSEIAVGDYAELPEEIKQKYVYKNSDGTVRNRLMETLICKCRQDGMEIEDAQVFMDKDLELLFFGGEETEYRISAFVDNKPAGIFDGKAYVDIAVSKDGMAVVQAELSKLVPDGEAYHSLYFVECPIARDGYDDLFMVDKTDSYVLRSLRDEE